MEKLSVIVPTFNEEGNIIGCLETINWADEIIIVDSFSTDKTLELAKQYKNVRIIQREYQYPASQKNWAIPQAAYDWVLILDADERLTDRLIHKIWDVLSKDYADGASSGYRILRQNYFLSKRIRYSGWQNDYVTRLFRKDLARYEDRFVHERLMVNGRVERLKNPILHYTYNSLGSYFEKMERYTTWAAMDKLRKGARVNWIIILFRTVYKFIRDFFLRFGFLDGTYGFILSTLSAFTEFTKYSKLWLAKNDTDFKRGLKINGGKMEEGARK